MTGDFIYQRKCDLGFGVDPTLRKLYVSSEPSKCLEVREINDYVVNQEYISFQKPPLVVSRS